MKTVQFYISMSLDEPYNILAGLHLFEWCVRCTQKKIYQIYKKNNQQRKTIK